MLTTMSAQDAMRLAESVDSTDPAVGLRAVASLRTLVERLEALHVAQARDQGWSWQDIGTALGVSKQRWNEHLSTRIWTSPKLDGRTR